MIKDIESLSADVILEDAKNKMRLLGTASQIVDLAVVEIRNSNIKNTTVSDAMLNLLRRLETDVALLTAAIARIEVSSLEQDESNITSDHLPGAVRH